MTSGVDELETFIAALRLSFLTSSSTAGSPEGLRQGINAFRETLRPRSTSTTEAHAQKSDHDHHSRSGLFALAEEPISSASTVWSCDDRIDALTKEIELVNSEVREGTGGIRELIQSVKELKTEVRELRSALAASKIVVNSETCPSSPTPIRTTATASASSTLVQEVQGGSSPGQCSANAPASLGPGSLARFLQEDTPLIVPHPLPSVMVRTPTPPCPPPVAEPAPPRIPSPVPAPAPCPVSVATSAHPQTSAAVDQTCSSGQVHPPFTCASGIMAPAVEDSRPASSSDKPQNTICDSVSGLENGSEVANPKEGRDRDPNRGDSAEAENLDANKVSDVAEYSDPPVVATAVAYYGGCSSEGELEFETGDKITILESPSTPVGWMYGELIEPARRGIFMAQYVTDLSDPKANPTSQGTWFKQNFEATEPGPGSLAIRVAMRGSNGLLKGELRIRLGDRITILDSPDTPDGWMYGEIVEKRRGIFPTSAPPENTHHDIEAFRGTLSSRSVWVTIPSRAEAAGPTPTARSILFEEDGERVNTPLKICSCGGRPDLSKQFEIFQAEVREGNSHIRELIQSVADLKYEVMNMRTALEAFKPVTTREAHHTSEPSSSNANKRFINLTPRGEAKVGPNSEEHSGVVSSAPSSAGARLGPKIRHASNARKTITLPPASPRPISSSSSPTNVSTQTETPSTIVLEPELSSPPTVPETTSSAEHPMPRPLDGKLNNCTCKPLSHSGKEKEAATTQKCNACSLNDGGTVEAEEVEDPENAGAKEVHPRPIIATAVKYFSAYNEGEIDLRPKDKITILDSPDTPADWMYGEIVETHRGIFPAQNIRELPRPDTKVALDGDSDIEDFEATELGSKSPVVMTAVSGFQASKRGQLSLSPEDTVTVLKSSGTPIGWKYGEIVKTRRGIFPARYVTLNQG
ncbi:hypothetical protein FRC01_004388 [Tulasnella sp. 417]|nr:hypothetical protein FRC01_004388 [Tulasnella sp. 417]